MTKIEKLKRKWYKKYGPYKGFRSVKRSERLLWMKKRTSYRYTKNPIFLEKNLTLDISCVTIQLKNERETRNGDFIMRKLSGTLTILEGILGWTFAVGMVYFLTVIMFSM